jgi:hypothetical protein
MNPLPKNHEELFRLFGGAVNDTLSEEEHLKLQGVLKQDSAARSLWFEFNDVECGLGELRPLTAEQLCEEKEALQAAAAPTWFGVRRWIAAAAAVLVALTLGGNYLVKRANAEPVIASFGAMKDPLWASPEMVFHRGDAIGAGQILELFAGSAEVYFGSGAKVTLYAPCIFQVTSENSAFLTFGQVKARADTREAKGFTLQTRTARMVDVGTEFVASAAADGESRVEVTSGEVHVHLTGKHGAQRLLKGDALSVAPGQQEVLIRIESGDGSPAFRFPSIESPTDTDYADFSQGVAHARLLQGYPAAESAPISNLLDGAGQTHADSAKESVFLANNDDGLVLLDLGQKVSVTKVNTYSWHRNPLSENDCVRATQKFTLYGFSEDTLPSTEGLLENHGWEFIGSVNTDDYFGVSDSQLRPEQQASSITAASGSLGRFRYLLWQVRPTQTGPTSADYNTFFGEFDVYAEP